MGITIPVVVMEETREYNRVYTLRRGSRIAGTMCIGRSPPLPLDLKMDSTRIVKVKFTFLIFGETRMNCTYQG